MQKNLCQVRNPPQAPQWLLGQRLVGPLRRRPGGRQ